MSLKKLFKKIINDKKINDSKKIIEEKNLFDEEYYCDNYPEVLEETDNLFEHYITKGFKKGYNPSDKFDTNYYLKCSGDVRGSGMNPLIHYVLYGMDEGRRPSPKFSEEEIDKAITKIHENNLFDEEFYYIQCPELKDIDIDPLKHYIFQGYKDGLNPCKTFDSLYYGEMYVNDDDLNPLVHYVLFNMNESENISNAEDFEYNQKTNKIQYSEDKDNIEDEKVQTIKEMTVEELKHCIDVIDVSNTFDDEFYLSQNQGLVNSTRSLIMHYVEEGAFLGKNPNKLFDTKFYEKNYPDVRIHALNPYVHYLVSGRKEGRAPAPTKEDIQYEKSQEDLIEKQIDDIINSGLFDEEYYIRRYPEVKYSLEEPLYHYLKHGYKEGKNPSRYFNTNYYLYKYPDVEENPLYHYVKQGQFEGRNSRPKLTNTEKEKYFKEISKLVESIKFKKFDKNAPLVSIIILNLNGAEHLRRLFETFEENTSYPNYELIVVDNGSKDESLDILENYEKKLPLTIIKNKINRTFSDANNQGAEIAKGEYLLFLNNDIKVLKGWLNNLMDTILSDENSGVIGSKLIYPDCSNAKYNFHKSYTIQHAGIEFKEDNGFIRPYNKDNGKPYFYGTNDVEEIAAVTAACMLVKKSKFEEVGRFDSGYNYGFEDVDLCLKLYKQGYTNYYNPKSLLYHYEFGTQETNLNSLVKNRRLSNIKLFSKKWTNWLKKEIFLDKINKNTKFTSKPLRIAFAVTETGEQATAGDYFTALGLANQLKELGHEIEFLSLRKNRYEDDWYTLDDNIDVVISLLDKFDLRQIKTQNNLLIKVAWLRNWFERWIDNNYFEGYDLVLVSSKKACEFIENKTGKKAILYPIATDPNMFNEKIPVNEDLECDYCFTGSYWDVKREIMDYLSPDDLDYKFNLYGLNWDKVPILNKYYKGFVDYNQIPEVYSSTKIVVDDSNHVTKEYGSVNSRVFDALASGKLVVTNGIIGAKEIFNDKLPTYDSKESLNELIEYYLKNPDKRESKIKELQSFVLENHTYEKRAEKFISLLEDFVNRTNLIIKTAIPIEKDKFSWGDYHFAINLQKEFYKKGCVAKIQFLEDWDTNVDITSDIVLLLRGLSIYEPKPQHYNIMWNISHPDDISIGEYDLYDKVYIASDYWTEKISPLLNVDVSSLLQCTNPEIFHREPIKEYETDLLFVGNSRLIYRKILHDLLPTNYKLDVYGSDWEGLIDDKYLKGEYISNDELYKAYSSTKVLLNDHWDDMREKGFISNRIFDAIACGTVTLTDDVKGVEELFPNAVVVYHSPDELDVKMEEAMSKGTVDSNLINDHTYAKRVEKILEDYENSL